MKNPPQGRQVATDRGECLGEGRFVGDIAGLGKNFDAAFAARRNKLPSRLVHRSPPPQKGQSLGACGGEPASGFQAEAAESAGHEVSAGQADRWHGGRTFRCTARDIAQVEDHLTGLARVLHEAECVGRLAGGEDGERQGVEDFLAEKV